MRAHTPGIGVAAGHAGAVSSVLVAMGPTLLAALLASVPHLVVRSSSASVEADRAVGDLLAIEASIEVSGVIRGFTYSVSSTVVLRSSAVLLSPLAMQGGRLVIDDGARLPRSITLAGTQVEGSLPVESEVRRTRGPSRNQARTMARLLPFERRSPRPGLDSKAIGRWLPGPEYRLEHTVDAPAELVVGGVARLTIVSDKVVSAIQRGYRGPTGTVLLTAVELADAGTAQAFWRALSSSVPEGAVSSSVKSALGDGAHWWFVKGTRGVLMWQHQRWFFALETRAADPAPTAPHEILALTERAQVSLSETLEEQP